MTPLHRYSLKILATWFGCGHAPKVPGTIGTLGAIPLVWWFSSFSELKYLVVTLCFAGFAIMVAHLYEMEIAGGEHDSPELVIDEVAGFLVTMALVPFTWSWVLLGFVLFRALDMLKPFPISYVDKKVLGGVGAVGDDLLAGVIANLILQVILQNGWMP
ncbi:MAG: phosphatidylglycerophosphatase A [Bdellovibrionales bacterium]|nr:phosphatidylglycerophosphatase A [Bdellovibrionales bacterium]